MSKLISTNTITVDGLADVGAWYVPDGGHDQASRDQFVGAAGMVLGRKTYEGLASYWPHPTGPWPDVLNPLPKFVASRDTSKTRSCETRSSLWSRGTNRKPGA